MNFEDALSQIEGQQKTKPLMSFEDALSSIQSQQSEGNSILKMLGNAVNTVKDKVSQVNPDNILQMIGQGQVTPDINKAPIVQNFPAQHPTLTALAQTAVTTPIEGSLPFAHYFTSPDAEEQRKTFLQMKPQEQTRALLNETKDFEMMLFGIGALGKIVPPVAKALVPKLWSRIAEKPIFMGGKEIPKPEAKQMMDEAVKKPYQSPTVNKVPIDKGVLPQEKPPTFEQALETIQKPPETPVSTKPQPVESTNVGEGVGKAVVVNKYTASVDPNFIYDQYTEEIGNLSNQASRNPQKTERQKQLFKELTTRIAELESKRGVVSPAEQVAKPAEEVKVSKDFDYHIMSLKEPDKFKTIDEVRKAFEQDKLTHRNNLFSEMEGYKPEIWDNLKDAKISEDKTGKITLTPKIEKGKKIWNEEKQQFDKPVPLVFQRVEGEIPENLIGLTNKSFSDIANRTRKIIKEISLNDKEFSANPTFILKDPETLSFKIANREYQIRTDAVSSQLPNAIQEQGLQVGDRIRFSPAYLSGKRPEIFIRKAGASTEGLADIGGYSDIRGKVKYSPRSIELPELVQFAKELLGGQYPKIREKLRIKNASGVYYPGKGEIQIKAGIFKNLNEATSVAAHEIGHLVDDLPEHIISQRGNILGRIANLKKYTKNLLEEYPGSPEKILTPKDRERIHREVENILKNRESTIVETQEPIYKEMPLTPEEVLSVWKDVQAREKDPKLYEYIARLSSQEKSSIMKEALKGKVPDWAIFKRQIIEGYKTVKKVILPDVSSEARRQMYYDLIRNEVVKRGLYEKWKITEELKGLTQELKPFDESADINYKKYRYSSKELYADAFSALINNPEFLESKAPTFYKAFFSYLKEKPEVSKLYNEIQNKLLDKEGLLKERFTNLEKEFGENVFAKEKQPLEIGEKLSEELVDKNAPFYRLEKELDKRGIKLPENEKVTYLLEENPYVAGEVFQFQRKVLADVLDPVVAKGITPREWDVFLFAKRIIGERKDIANPRGFSPETAQGLLGTLRGKVGNEKFQFLENQFKKWQDYRQSDIISKVETSGRFSPELIKYMKENEVYSKNAVKKYFLKTYGSRISGHIYKQIGTFEDIASPFVSTMVQDAQLLRIAHKQEVTTVAEKMLRKYFPETITDAQFTVLPKGKGIIRIPKEPKNPDMGLVVTLKEGKLNGIYIPKVLAKILNGEDTYRLQTLTKVMNSGAQLFKNIWINYNPVWAMRNIIKDLRGSAIKLPETGIVKAIPIMIKRYIQSLPHAYQDVVKNVSTPLVEQMYKERKLLPGGYYTGKSITADELLAEVLKGSTDSVYRENQNKAYYNLVVKPLSVLGKILQTPSQVSERMGKIAGEIQMQAIGETGKRGASIVRNRAGTPGFTRKGQSSPVVNSIALFSNIAKEDWRSSFEAFRENPKEVGIKTLLYSVLPKAVLYGGTIGLLGNEMKNLIDEIPDYDKTNYNVVPLGRDSNDKPIYLRIPDSFNGQTIGGIFWKTATQNTKADFTSLNDYLAGSTPYSSLNPMIGFAMDSLMYSSGINPPDYFRGGNKISEMEFKAGGSIGARAFLKSELNDAFSSIYRFKGNTVNSIKSELETILDSPGAGTLLGSFIKVSDRGMGEQLKEIGKEVESNDAARHIKVRERIIDDINKTTDSGKKPNMGNIVKLRNELIKEGFLKRGYSVNSFKNLYNGLNSKSLRMPEVDAFSIYRNKTARDKMLETLKNRQSQGEYNKTKQTIRKYGLYPKNNKSIIYNKQP